MDPILAKYYSLTPKQKKTVLEKFNAILDENEEVRKKSGKKTVKKFKAITELKNERDIAVFEKLRAWRNRTAEESGLEIKSEAWKIMKNDPLKNIAYYRPKNEEEFLKVDGMTEEIFANYGQAILGILGVKSDVGTFTTNVKPAKVSRKPVKKIQDDYVDDDPIEEEILPKMRFLPPNE